MQVNCQIFQKIILLVANLHKNFLGTPMHCLL